MASYKLSVKRSAEKELRKIPRSDLRRVIETIQALTRDSRPHGVRLLKGPERHWRVRQGDYRIIYEVDDAAHHITIIKVGHRREIYDQ
jgi:mRNA interferase RelE/StbE